MNFRSVVCAVFLITALITSACLQLANASSAINANSARNSNKYNTIGETIYDWPSILKSLGYTQDQLKNVSNALLDKQLSALTTSSHKDANGNTVISFSRPSGLNISDIKLDVKSIDSKSLGASTMSLLPGKACIVIAIWDYPGTLNDLGTYTQNAYTNLWGYVTGQYSPYTYEHSLVNSEATHDNVNAWITWACASYQNVDLYLIGHGSYQWRGPPYFNPPWDYVGAYCCYDSLPYVAGMELIDSTKYFWETDLKSFDGDSYDYSTLRLGFAGCCYGGYFSNTFLNPGGATSHSRALMGTETKSWNDYVYYFEQQWAYNWYAVGLSSNTGTNSAFHYAYVAAQPYVHDSAPFNYYGSSIYK